MSWHYLRELVEGFSAGNYLDGERLEQSKSQRIVAAFSSEDNKTVCFPCSQYGTTSKLSDRIIKKQVRISKQLAVWLRSLSQQDFLVNRIAQRDDVEEQMTRAIFGRTLFVSYGKSNQKLRCWKMSQGFFPSIITARSLGNWPNQGMILRGKLYLQVHSDFRIFAKDFGYLRGKMKKQLRWKEIKVSTLTDVALSSMVGGTMIQPTFFPMSRTTSYHETPTTKGLRGGSSSKHHWYQWRKPGQDENGELNPSWVEWLMGWPIDWTDLKSLEMDKWRSWQRSLLLVLQCALSLI